MGEVKLSHITNPGDKQGKETFCSERGKMEKIVGLCLQSVAGAVFL